MPIDEVKVKEIEERTKSNLHRIDGLERKVDDLTSLTQSVAVLALKQDTTQRDVEEIKENVKSLMSLPGKRYDAIVEKVIIMVVAAVVTYALTKFGL